MNISRFLTLTLTSCLFVLFIVTTTFAQTTNATLSGNVEDEQGSVIPGVRVTATDPATGLRRSVVTDTGGAYVIPLLPPGTYTVTAEGDGFTRVQFPNVVLNVNDRRSLRIQLSVGSITEAIEVRPDASLINTESGTVATTVDRTFVGNLPLSGRSLQTLIFLSPGIVYSPSQASSPGEFSVNGQRSNANYFTVDGVAANTGINPLPPGNSSTSNQLSGMLPGLGATGSTSTLVSVDALEEFKIQTSTYSAQFGRQPGGQVQLSTRSGGNEFHGTVFEYIRNEAFDSNNWFENALGRERPPTRLNQFGGTFSGPVYLPRFGEGGRPLLSGKDRTFFFFSFEGQRLRLPDNSLQNVPSLRLRNVAPDQFKPILNAFPLPTGDEILVTCNPATAGCLPNGTRPTGVAPFFSSHSNPSSQDATSIRIDHKISNAHSFFGRYNYAPSNSLIRNLARLSGTEASSHTFTSGLNSIFTSRLTNDFRFNYTRSRAVSSSELDTFGGAVPIDDSVLLPGYTGETNQVQGVWSMLTTEGIVGLTVGDSAENQQRQYNFVDNLTWTVGNHSLTFGFDYRRLAPILAPLRYSQFARPNIQTAAQEALFLQGRVQFVNINSQGGVVRPRFDNISTYVQDAWRVSRRLTLDLGLRWELNLTPSEADGQSPVLVTDVNESVLNARLLGPNEAWYKTDYTAFAPRFGAAYVLNEKEGRETVLRGGFGVFYDLNSGLAVAAYQGYPFTVSRQEGTNIPWPITPAQATPPSPLVVALPITSNLRALNKDLKLPNTLQWNFSVEQSLGKSQTLTVGYVASAGRRLTTRQFLNQPIGTATGPRPNPNFGTIDFVTNGPSSDYHSMQAQYQRRLSKGLQALVNYTWSHAIDEVSSEDVIGVLSRGSADFDVRHNFTAAVTYNVPRWKQYAVADALLRDWSFDTVVLVYSGRPLDIRAIGFLGDTSGIQTSVRPDVVPGEPFWINDSTVPGGRIINVNAFRLPPLVSGTTNRFQRPGTLGRNVVRQSGFYQVNLAVRREFRLTERFKLQLRAEAFNLLNTPFFSNYNTVFTPGSTSFGRARSTLNNTSTSVGLNTLYALGGPRSMQFSVRLSF